jgi:hypothetical protein
MIVVQVVWNCLGQEVNASRLIAESSASSKTIRPHDHALPSTSALAERSSNGMLSATSIEKGIPLVNAKSASELWFTNETESGMPHANILLRHGIVIGSGDLGNLIETYEVSGAVIGVVNEM